MTSADVSREPRLTGAHTTIAVRTAQVTPRPETRFPSLDGLRAISIAMVMFAHCVGTRGFPIHFAERLGNLGDLGVRVFFVISGFLITGLLLQEIRSRNRIGIARFYARRSLRIFPAAYLFVAVVWLLDATHVVQSEALRCNACAYLHYELPSGSCLATRTSLVAGSGRAILSSLARSASPCRSPSRHVDRCCRDRSVPAHQARDDLPVGNGRGFRQDIPYGRGCPGNRLPVGRHAGFPGEQSAVHEVPEIKAVLGMRPGRLRCRCCGVWAAQDHERGRSHGAEPVHRRVYSPLYSHCR